MPSPLKQRSFIAPALPSLRDRFPSGPEWIAEVKLDGYRAQLHKCGDSARILSKNGHDLSSRFPRLITQVQYLRCRDAVLDGEVVICNADGTPNFRALHSGNYDQSMLVVWCFDLMVLDGADHRHLPLLTRRHHLQKLIAKSEQPALCLSEAFDDPAALLQACDARGLEGIVMKKKGSPYRSGKCDWVKIKTARWKAENVHRGELFKA